MNEALLLYKLAKDESNEMLDTIKDYAIPIGLGAAAAAGGYKMLKGDPNPTRTLAAHALRMGRRAQGVPANGKIRRLAEGAGKDLPGHEIFRGGQPRPSRAIRKDPRRTWKDYALPTLAGGAAGGAIHHYRKKD